MEEIHDRTKAEEARINREAEDRRKGIAREEESTREVNEAPIHNFPIKRSERDEAPRELNPEQVWSQWAASLRVAHPDASLEEISDWIEKGIECPPHIQEWKRQQEASRSFEEKLGEAVSEGTVPELIEVEAVREEAPIEEATEEVQSESPSEG